MTTEEDSGAGPDQKSGEKDISALRRITLVVLGFAVVLFLYFVVADRTTPFTSDARVQAFVLRVAPEVNGQVQTVAVTDNAVVDKGALLFEIDPTPFNIAVKQAEARLAQAGQTIGASTASVDVAQARLDEARAAEANIRVQSGRILDLVKRGIYAKAREDQAIAAIQEGRAAVESAEADLQRAREELGPQGQNNPQILDAMAALQKARFDLSRTTVTTPNRGVVTNLQLAVGQTVVAGQPAMTFISAEDFWLLGSFRENSIAVLEPGQVAEVVLDSLPGRVFRARLETIGWGIAGGSADPATGLPKSTTETGWMTDPERFPVQFTFVDEKLPRGPRYGSRAAIVVYSHSNPIMRGIAWVRIRLIALLTYVS